jgi:chromate reductase, NAD(P)H dehydrogenase (quinone)
MAIPGSTRKGSSNESILRYLANRYNDTLDVSIFESIEKLPHFNPDHDKDMIPDPVADFRRKIEEADGILICTPEYIFALPGVLKNAIEWTVSTTLFSDKPVAFIVASGIGEETFKSLALIMETVGARAPINSRLLIQGGRAKVDSTGKVVDVQTSLDLATLMESFLQSMVDSRMPI